MTIAAVYVSPEGVVLGADSTATLTTSDGKLHYFNHAQKLFQIGEGGSVGVVAWGLGGLEVSSHRQLIARLADQLKASAASSVQDIAVRWATLFHGEYVASSFFKEVARLGALPPYGSSAADARSEEEEAALPTLQHNLTVGFCIAGHVDTDRNPGASVVIFDYTGNMPAPSQLVPGQFSFWGAPNMVKRLLWGCDDSLKAAVEASPHWTGAPGDLDKLVQERFLSHGVLPMRDAIDFVNFCIFSTIKAFKFSNFSQICGGPIELAVITADRPFRWVKHKEWDSAIQEGEC